ncbi:cell division transport system ATP-binding protein [Cryobacterium sp. MP_M5]|uniref:cell division ATP-binding protein FtsE n=1 Tax=unclassified Cryobacterium TaxID=2649013 RepID=UPI0018CBE238|nr:MULTISPECIES: cell division ATP-binding protein FtsE [unclassified Cryobacterium]MBG6057820.1 cell division transport system ATP-binding protein [Cryobacterium sp. MP_M3]MEC5176019.1 cell division transport system ATP-binding protein [Cryobacterium sp. MP_M5]
MIRFDHITKKYPGTNRPALDDIDVEVLRGEFVFLVGASGSGKSTCLRLVLKEDRPTSGSIHVLGQDLRSISNRKVPYFRRNLGVVFQDFRLLPNKTVFDNVAFSLQVIGKSRGFIQEAVPDTLKMVGLAEKAQRFPHELSGGEQQRVAIARAIVNKPQVLLADEPTGNLDPTTSAGIMALLERINAGGTTVIMATHEAGIVDQMQRRVIELASGKIVRDERQGGYATAAIPTITEGAGTHRRASAQAAPAPAAPIPATQAPAAAPRLASAFAPTPSEPLTFPPAAEPVAAPAPAPAVRHEPAPTRAGRAQAAAIAADTGMPLPHVEPEPEPTQAADPGRPMARPALPVTQHDVPEQLTLAEKLGLRAPGEKTDPSGEQNVGPTR